MDLVAAVGFTASIVQPISVTTKPIKYLNYVKDAPKYRAKLALIATSLLALRTKIFPASSLPLSQPE